MKLNSKNIQSLIDSNFADLCISMSCLTGSVQKNCKYFSWAKNPFDNWFSRVLKINFPGNLINESIDCLRTEIESEGAPSSLLLTKGRYYDIISDLLKSNYFNMVYEQTGMYLNLKDAIKTTIRDYDIRVIDNSSEFNKWNDVVEQVFNKRKSTELYGKLLKEQDFTFFACFDQQRVIATTMLFMNKEIAGVHLVGVLEEFRKKGIGAEITKRAFEFAKSKGAKAGVLQASSIGKNMYKEIGFKEYSHITHWEYHTERSI